MTQPQAPDPQSLIDLRSHAAEMIKSRVPVKEAEKALVERGYDPAAVAEVIRTMETGHSDSMKSTGMRNMIIGGLVCLVGTLITVGTLAATRHGGGTYIVAYGAIIFGAVQFFRGLSQYIWK